jgi:hypothetical protein
MSDGVLLDTSFLISFADPARPHHAVAVQYFKFFASEGIPMFLSAIAASEFHQKQPVTDLPLDAIIVLPFNLVDAMRAAELDFTLYKGTPGVTRDALKDDFKLLGQVKANDIAFVLTEDDRSLYKFCRELRAKHVLSAHAVKLDDGFSKSHFAPDGQSDFDAGLETSQTDTHKPAPTFGHVRRRIIELPEPESPET